MSNTSLGKKFEAKFKKDWEECFPNELVYRLPDQMSGYGASNNPCDFFAFADGNLFMTECKETKEASIPWTSIRQRDKLIEYYHKGYKNVFQGVIIWFSEKDTVIYVSAQEMEKMVEDGEKSIGLRMLKSDYKKSYNIIVIPSEKVRTFMKSNYKYLVKTILENRGE